MKESYNNNSPENLFSLRNKIIGLGENSIKKNYYPELQEKLIELGKINLRNKALLNGIPDAFLLLDTEGNILEFHPAANSDDKFFNNNLKGENIFDVFPKDIADIFNSYLAKQHEVDEIIQFDFKLPIDGTFNYYEARAVMIYKNEFLFIIRDITQMVLMIERLKFLGSRDCLTGLYNRTVFEERMKDFENRPDSSIGIIICDVDGLKFINDTLGHKAGDQVLKITADIILRCIRPSDITARIGGDEFGILLQDIDNKSLEGICNKIEEEIANYHANDDRLKIGLSVGYAFGLNSTHIADILFQEADNTMYRKKLLKNSGIRSAMVKTLMKALEARDYITEGHAERLGNTAVLIGKKLELSEKNLDEIKLLAKFHDIGKVGIPDNILFKPEKLTDDEMRIMQGHCEIGHRIANSAPELSHIADFILMHHEKWNGNGYPIGLSEVNIPIECRIIAIADAYDAMSNDRPYRKAMKKDEIINEVVKNSGTQFDPDIVNVFIELIKNEQI